MPGSETHGRHGTIRSRRFEALNPLLARAETSICWTYHLHAARRSVRSRRWRRAARRSFIGCALRYCTGPSDSMRSAEDPTR